MKYLLLDVKQQLIHQYFTSNFWLTRTFAKANGSNELFPITWCLVIS
jgi:hypothetical protein